MAFSKEHLRTVLQRMLDYCGLPILEIDGDRRGAMFYNDNFNKLVGLTRTSVSPLNGATKFVYTKELDTLVLHFAELDNYHRLKYTEKEAHIDLTEGLYEALIEILKPDYEKAYLRKSIPDPYLFFAPPKVSIIY
jgi:hypothetical protein